MILFGQAKRKIGTHGLSDLCTFVPVFWCVSILTQVLKSPLFLANFLLLVNIFIALSSLPHNAEQFVGYVQSDIPCYLSYSHLLLEQTNKKTSHKRNLPFYGIGQNPQAKAERAREEAEKIPSQPLT